MSAARRGTVLLIVVGLGAIMATLALALLARTRDDGAEADRVVRQAQARAMLTAALAYVQETARMGWTWSDPAHPGYAGESYGWIDARDGSPGPKDRWHQVMARDAAGAPMLDPVTGLSTAADGGWFPAVGGRAARCPMHLLAQPPCAVRTTWAYNPVPRSPRPYAESGSLRSGAISTSWRDDLSYHELDPQPVEPAADAGSTSGWARRFAAWRAGDARPRPGTQGMAWFRCYRATPADCAAHRGVDGRPAPLAWSPAVFILACGAGGTRGWRDWSEVVAAGASDEFGGDPALFTELRAREELAWYACEWSPAEGFGASVHTYEPDSYTTTALQVPWRDSYLQRTHSMNFGGSFLWIERLPREPGHW